jgi:ammonium transporter, Amt family
MESISRGEQIGVQLLGIVSFGVWTFGVAYLVLKVVDMIVPLRVSADHEIIGLNISEHGVRQEIDSIQDAPRSEVAVVTK